MIRGPKIPRVSIADLHMETSKRSDGWVVSFSGINNSGKEVTLIIKSSEGLSMWLSAPTGPFVVERRPTADPKRQALLRIEPDFFKVGSTAQQTRVDVRAQMDGKNPSGVLLSKLLTRTGNIS